MNKTLKQIKISYHQRGAALLIGMVVMAAVTAFYLMGQFGAVSPVHDRQDQRSEQLGTAKRALIAHAVAYIDQHPGEFGFMPCPDQVLGGLPEGEQESFCSGNKNESVIGRLPWRTLDLGPIKDDANECLWYAVSGAYKHTNTAGDKADMLNEDTNGAFQVFDAAGNLIYGASAEQRVVAVVFSPGKPLPGQNRQPGNATAHCGGPYSVADYLEGDGDIDNASLGAAVAPDSVDRFIKATGSSDNPANASPFNDRLITITRDEIWNAVKKRRDFIPKITTLTTELANCLRDYGNAGTARNLPWPAPVALADYRIDQNYSDTDMGAGSVNGRLPNQVEDSEAQLATNPGPGGNGNGNGNAGGNGNGNGNAGGNGNGGGNGNAGGNGGNGGGGNVTVPTNPPTGGPACDGCWIELQKEIAEADAEYQQCIDNGDPPGQCKNERRDEYQEAVAEYDACLATNACTPGAPPGGGSTPKGEEFVLFDPALEPNDADPAYTGDPLTCLNELNGKLWKHWKDHFFYAVSADFSPTSTDVRCNGNCLTTTNGLEHAAIVIFSGSRTAGQFRTGPVVSGDPDVADDPDDKQDIVNYLLEENRDADALYEHTSPDDDLLVCIDPGANTGDPLVVTDCN